MRIPSASPGGLAQPSAPSRAKLRDALGQLQSGDTLVIYKPDR